MRKYILTTIVLTLFITASTVFAQESTATNQNRKDGSDKVQKLKSAADKTLDQRIENLTKLRDRVILFKNVNDTDKTSIGTVITNVINDLTDLRSFIESATSTEVIKQARENINNNYRVYALISPQLSIIASADRMITTISMLNIVSSKIEVRLSAVATGTDITSANLAAANKSLQSMKDRLVQSQMDAQSAVNLVAPLLPDQGDKAVMESNQLVMKDARAKIKSAQTNIVNAKKDAEAITKILAKERKEQKTATSTQSDDIKSTNKKAQ